MVRKLDPNLSILPLGILRQSTLPYVTEEGPIDFINPRVHQAIVTELAKNYREYFVENLELFIKWSIPGRLSSEAEERNAQLAETEMTRNSIARFTGEVGKNGFDDVKPILEAWGDHHIGGIGKTVGIALKETVTDSRGAQHALLLLQEWAADTTERYRRWACGSALWRIVSATRLNLTDVALQQLVSVLADLDIYRSGWAEVESRLAALAEPIIDQLLSDVEAEKVARIPTPSPVIEVAPPVTEPAPPSVLARFGAWLRRVLGG